MEKLSVKLGDLLVGTGKIDPPVVKKEEKKVKVVKKEKQPIKAAAENKKSREDSMSVKSGAVNIQDQFLNHLRREKAPVTVHLTDGKELHGHIKSFDNFCIHIENSNHETLVYKHGISSISPSRIEDYSKK